MLMIFRYHDSVYKSDHKVKSCHGETEIPEFVLDQKPAGGVQLKKVGIIPIYAKIQANKVNCDLQAVLESCVHENQLAACDISDVTGSIADFSGMSNMAEWYSGIKQLDQTWDRMPVEVREQFNSSRVNFVNSLQEPDFMEKLQTGFNAYEKSVNKRLKVGDVPPIVEKPDVEKPDVKKDGDDK